MPSKNKSNEIKIIRIYDAPLKLVWEAWTDPKQAAKWWGPRGFTLTTHSKELKPGGIWHYTMHGPDGTDYPSNRLVQRPQRSNQNGHDDDAPDSGSGRGNPEVR